jgi:hypothetical protein
MIILGPVRRKQLLAEIHELLLADPDVTILRGLEECLASGTVPLALQLGGQRVELSLLARRRPLNFRLHRGQEHIFSLEQLASMERPEEACSDLHQTVLWIRECFLELQILQLR